MIGRTDVHVTTWIEGWLARLARTVCRYLPVDGGRGARLLAQLPTLSPYGRRLSSPRRAEILTQRDPTMAQTYTLRQAFLALVRERQGDALEAWMTAAVASGIEALTRFAQGLQEDRATVKAGLTLPWSNRPVEGHVNRLKLLKRQGDGRADVGLLR